MKLLEISEDNYQKIIEETVKVLRSGGLMVFPSDTVYILAVDPTNEEGVKKLLEFKNRWTGKAISVAVLDKKMARDYVNLNENGENIYTNLLPGPFTIVSNGKHKVIKEIEAENGTLGIRIPDNKYVHDLVKLLGKPVTATSANLSGRTPNYSIASFLKPLSNKKKEMIDLIVDAGKLPRNKPSTVIDATEAELKILRRGDLVTKNSQTLISKSEKETEKIAEFLLKKFGGKPIIFALTGDLGCGKTVFSRKIGHLLGVKERITSPTFVIYNEYKLVKSSSILSSYKVGDIDSFLHFDLYRISADYELEEIKFFDLFKNNVACVEWPENMGEKNFERLKKENKVVTIQFKYLDEKTREIRY
ncbi:MAG: L-threonylcarbamoyladenylate synthase [Candidatus Shapirobacteria bacterium]|nr:L-threonylcarbamoyladenylate synthase [Candidatus Shapirobacteria bacterium]MDD3002502.1 L-threonylcarbamoyladenylate synthase [Candidatus Shapirobacteria bacterium]MDD4383407.1 L-threonylcarbamoyladenylate synthase [Candidatus Shapirobacteria bacterium]